MSLTSKITSPSGPNEELFGGAPKLLGCGVQTCAVVVGVDVVGPTITGEGPGEEPLGIVRVGHVDNRQDAADASKLLADVVRLSVVGPAAHVAKTIGHRD